MCIVNKPPTPGGIALTQLSRHPSHLLPRARGEQHHGSLHMQLAGLGGVME